jgi:hypothetical protein
MLLYKLITYHTVGSILVLDLHVGDYETLVVNHDLTDPINNSLKSEGVCAYYGALVEVHSDVKIKVDSPDYVNI